MLTNCTKYLITLFIPVALYAQTSHLSTIIGVPNGNALNIDGPSAGNGDIVLVPGNVSGHSSALVDNGRTDQPALIISQQHAGNITSSDVLRILDGSGNTVFGITGAGVAAGFPGPNALSLYGNLVPNSDNAYYDGLAAFAWKQSNVHLGFFEEPLICIAGNLGNTSLCEYMSSVAAGELTIWQPDSTTRATEFVEFLANSGTGQHFAQFNLDIVPNANLSFQLGSNSLIWQTLYVQELLNTGSTTSINGVTYTWPSANAAGSLINNGTGGLSWGPGAVCGSDTDVIYNSAGVCGADANLTWDYTNGVLTVLPVNAASPGIKISQSHTNATGELLQILDHSGATVFEINGSGASLLPNYLIVNGMDPFTDDTANLGAGNAGWKQVFSYDNFQQTSQICTPGSGFTTSDCTYFRSNAAGSVDLMSPGGTLQMAEFLYNSGTGQKYAQFQGAVIPYTSTTFDLGTNSLIWNNAYVAELFNTGSTISINGVTYTWPSSSSNGCLDNTGGTISFVTCGGGGGVTSLNGLTGAVTTVGLGAFSVGGSITPNIGNTYNLGTSSLNFNEIFVNQLDNEGAGMTINSTAYNWPLGNASGMLTNNGSGTLSWSPPGCPTGGSGAIQVYNTAGVCGGNNSVFWATGSEFFSSLPVVFNTTLSVSGAVTFTSPSSTALQVTGGATFGAGVAGIGASGVAVAGGSVCYIANGLTGQSVTTTIRDSAGTGTCTEIFTCGIKTGGTC